MTIKKDAVKEKNLYGVLHAEHEGKPFVAKLHDNLDWECDDAVVDAILFRSHNVLIPGTLLVSGGRTQRERARMMLFSAYEAFGGTLELGPDSPPKPQSEWQPPPPEELQEVE